MGKCPFCQGDVNLVEFKSSYFYGCKNKDLSFSKRINLDAIFKKSTKNGYIDIDLNFAKRLLDLETVEIVSSKKNILDININIEGSYKGKLKYTFK